MLFIFLLTSCSFYFDTYELKIDNLKKGKIVISSNSFYREIVIDNPKVYLDINKYEDVFISYYPYFNGDFSRFPQGCYLKPGNKKVTLDNKLGLLCQAANENHFKGIKTKFDDMESLISTLNKKWDPWVYNKQEVKMVLKGDISLSSLTTKSKFEIDNLNYLYSWQSENPCLIYWYPMIVSFSNVNGDIYSLNIKEDGSYVGFYRR